MGALFGLLIIIVLSIIVVRIGAVALELTGLSPDVAAFQAQSAFSGVGFTTSESEAIVSHPVRRRIIRFLFLLGGAGITSSIATFVLTFVGQSGKNIALRVEILTVGLLCILLFARSEYISRVIKKVIKKALEKWTTVRIYDYEHLLGLSKGYNVSRIKVKEGSWMVDRSLEELRLNLEGILILAVYRTMNGEEKFIGVPEGQTVIREGDVLICYAREESSKCLAQRLKDAAGDRAHEEGVKKERELAQIRKITGGYM